MPDGMRRAICKEYRCALERYEKKIKEVWILVNRLDRSIGFYLRWIRSMSSDDHIIKMSIR